MHFVKCALRPVHLGLLKRTTVVHDSLKACIRSAQPCRALMRFSMCSGAKVMVDVIKLSQQRAKPSVEEFQGILQPLAEAMQKAESLTHGARTKATNHHKAITECIQTFAWITYDVSAGDCSTYGALP